MQSRPWPQAKELAGARVLWGSQQEGQGVLREVGSSGSANLEMAFPGLLLTQTQRAFPVLLQTRRSEQEVLPRSMAKRMNNANEQCLLFLNSPQAVGSPPENKILEKHPKRDQLGQADLLRWHRSRAKISEEGRVGSAALQSRHHAQPCHHCSQRRRCRSSSSWCLASQANGPPPPGELSWLRGR